MPVAALNEEKNSNGLNNVGSSTYIHETQLATTDAVNKLSDDLSEISCNLDMKPALSEDSKDIPMAFYYTTHGTFQAGADGGCFALSRPGEQRQVLPETQKWLSF